MPREIYRIYIYVGKNIKKLQKVNFRLILISVILFLKLLVKPDNFEKNPIKACLKLFIAANFFEAKGESSQNRSAI